MGFTYNITFVIDRKTEGLFLDYLRNRMVPNILPKEETPHPLQLKKLIEAGGEQTPPGHDPSYALSAEFNSEGNARQWHDRSLIPELNHLHEKFDSQVLFFVTLLENLYI